MSSVYLMRRCFYLLFLIVFLVPSFAAAVEDPNGKTSNSQFDVSLRDILLIALERSITLKSERLNEKIARYDIIAAEDRNNPVLTNSVTFGKSVSSSGPSSTGNFRSLSGAETVTLCIECWSTLPS